MKMISSKICLAMRLFILQFIVANASEETQCLDNDRFIYHNGNRVNIHQSYPSTITNGLNVTTIVDDDNNGRTIQYVQSFVSPTESSAIRGFCTQKNARFKRSPLTDSGATDSDKDSVRTSSSCPLFFAYFYMDRMDELKVKRPDLVDELQLTWDVTVRAADLLGVEPPYIEPFQMIRYEPGEFYREHHDHRAYYDPEGGYPDRSKTMLLFLNDLDETMGGRLEFGRLGLEFPPRDGDAVIWSNVDKDGKVDPEMVHQGMPPGEGGSKMAVNIWVRDTPFTSPQQAAMRQH